MTLEETRFQNMMIFYLWMANGHVEAYEDLNDSNRKVIRSFSETYPEAICFNSQTMEIFRPDEKNLCNFCCDYILDGKMTDRKKLLAFARSFKESGKFSDLEKMESEIKKASGYRLTWS